MAAQITNISLPLRWYQTRNFAAQIENVTRQAVELAFECFEPIRQLVHFGFEVLKADGMVADFRVEFAQEFVACLETLFDARYAAVEPF